MGLQIRLESARCGAGGEKSGALLGRGNLSSAPSGSLRCAAVAGGAGVGRLEAYPNRDCLRYLRAMDLPRCVISSRDPAVSRLVRNLEFAVNLGLLDTEPGTWAGQSYGVPGSLSRRHGSGLVDRLARRLGVDPDRDAIARLEWLGLLSDRPIPETDAARWT